MSVIFEIPSSLRMFPVFNLRQILYVACAYNSTRKNSGACGVRGQGAWLATMSRSSRNLLSTYFLAISTPGMDSQAIGQYPSDSAVRKRKRTACRACRERRVKCDNGRPSCHSCCTLKLVCVYPDDRSSASPKLVGTI